LGAAGGGRNGERARCGGLCSIHAYSIWDLVFKCKGQFWASRRFGGLWWSFGRKVLARKSTAGRASSGTRARRRSVTNKRLIESSSPEADCRTVVT
jgi:hypothetical protein